MRVEGSGFRVQVMVCGLPQGSPHCPPAPTGMSWVEGAGFRVQGSGFRVQGVGFMFRGSGFRVQGSGFKVQGLVFRV